MFLQSDNSFSAYYNLSLQLKNKPRKGYGTMFRHQLETFAILMEYGFTDMVLLKASLIHDLVEDVPGFDKNEIVKIDKEGKQVLELVKEVTKRQNNGINEPKDDFLLRIMNEGSPMAKVLKLADRISNVASLAHSNDLDFIKKYISETRTCILPYAKDINEHMFNELVTNIERIEKTYNL